MPQAFISYAQKDLPFADWVRLKLKDVGIQVWLDQGALKAGMDWRNAIDEGIASSDVMLVVLTEQSCKSLYVTYEWSFALGKGIHVIPLLFGEAKVPIRLEALQYLDFRDPLKGPWEPLFQEITRHGDQSTTREASAYVRDMTVDQLQELIAGTVSLATATAKTAGHEAAPADFSRAAKTVVDVMRQTTRTAWRSAEAPPRHVLWVDDRPNNNVHERGAFEALGLRFTLALSTDEALQRLAEQTFSAIISDMGRREGPREGYVLLEALRSQGDDTPFFIYAGSNAPEHRREAKRRGAQGSTNNAQELLTLVTRSLK